MHASLPLRASRAALFVALLISSAAVSAQPDTLFVVLPDTAAAELDIVRDTVGWTYQLAPLSVSVDELRLSESEATVSKTALHGALRRSGLHLVRRGVALGGDFALDGFSGTDVAVVVDGERYPSSCPNRMDPPATRVNPLEVAAVRVDRSAATTQAGLGGAVAFERARPAQSARVRFGLTQTGTAGVNTDAVLAVEGRGQRVSGRLLRGRSYADGGGDSFGTRYGYTDAAVAYSLVETAARGEWKDWRYGGSLAITRDLPFPFLMMDERDNRMWSAHLGWRDHKVYANRTRHLMDNGLRASAEQMRMETDATNLTVGATGSLGDATDYELYARRWDAWNTAAMAPMHDDPMPGMDEEPMAMRQHVVPDVRLVAASLSHGVEIGLFALNAKLGLRQAAADAERLAYFRTLYPEADAEHWAVPFGLSLGYTVPLGRKASVGFTAELASEAPAPERLFIGVRRTMGAPSWSGNPTLGQPVKTALRSVLVAGRLRLNAFASHVDGAVTLAAADAGDAAFVTYTNADALVAGFDARAEWVHLALSTSYTWGQNLDAGAPLAETPPLMARATAFSPSWHGLAATFTAEAATAQHRVATDVGETATPGWVRFDAGLAYEAAGVTLALEAVNLTDALYYEHLAYRRDPFSAGRTVFEPGRLLRLRLHVLR
jgi:iron complex outermembrane receptor protein